MFLYAIYVANKCPTYQDLYQKHPISILTQQNKITIKVLVIYAILVRKWHFSFRPRDTLGAFLDEG